MIKTKYKYNVGDTVKTLKGSITIVKQIEISVGSNGYHNKGYEYVCDICKYKGIISESNLQKNQGCKVCGGSRVVTNFTDIATLHPDKIEYFFNPEDAKKFALKSNKKADFKCSICGDKIKNKVVSTYTNTPPLCAKCRDTMSYPERVLYTVFKHAKLQFKHDVKTDWSQNKRYDFILENKIIVETHGAQHYTKPFTNGRTIKEERLNDAHKKVIAQEHNYEYIELDCSKSDFKYIKNSIISSKLNTILGFSDGDWEKVEEEALKPKWIEVAEIWNSGIKSITRISNLLSINPRTIASYLKKCSELGICDYDPIQQRNIPSNKRGNPKKVICLNNNYIFNKMCQATKWANGNKHIFQCCKGVREYAGKHPVTGEKLQWMYLNDYYIIHSEITDQKEFEENNLFKG